MRSMYLTTLEELIKGTPANEEISDWLGVLAPYVAKDTNFTGREGWRKKAVSLIVNTIGRNARVLNEVKEAFFPQGPVGYR